MTTHMGKLLHCSDGLYPDLHHANLSVQQEMKLGQDKRTRSTYSIPQQFRQEQHQFLGIRRECNGQHLGSVSCHANAQLLLMVNCSQEVLRW